MKVKTLNTTTADRASARVFFKTLNSLYDMSNLEVLDAFARNGELTVKNYARRVKSVTCWELGEEHRTALQSIAGVKEVLIGCSYDITEFESKIGGASYDMVVIDTPQGLHKDYDGTLKCEHFDFLNDCINELLKDEGLLVLYVNLNPYDRAVHGEHGYDQYDEYDFQKWMERRKTFYGSAVIHEDQALTAYRHALARHGYSIMSVVMVPCYSDVPGYPDYALRLGLSVRKVKSVRK